MTRAVPVERIREEIISILAQVGVTPDNRPNFEAEVEQCARRLRQRYPNEPEPAGEAAHPMADR